EERNAPLRAGLAAAIRAADFGAPEGVARFRAALAAQLAAFPDDLRILERAAAATAAASRTGPLRDALAEEAPGASLQATLDATVFGFDQETLAAIRAAPDPAAAAALLRRLLEPRLAEPGAAGLHPPPNMPTPCADEPAPGAPPRPHCAGRRLVVPRERREAFYALLAADARSSGLAVFAPPPAFDPREFVQRPGEWLRIRG
ncbi:MAG TPA: hypothetical protein VNI01_04820, partial [Elusimicrobiota bacterium]|nr:hypothetical protein [Elusimicrobiota bacterium]